MDESLCQETVCCRVCVPSRPLSPGKQNYMCTQNSEWQWRNTVLTHEFSPSSWNSCKTAQKGQCHACRHRQSETFWKLTASVMLILTGLGSFSNAVTHSRSLVLKQNCIIEDPPGWLTCWVTQVLRLRRAEEVPAAEAPASWHQKEKKRSGIKCKRRAITQKLLWSLLRGSLDGVNPSEVSLPALLSTLLNSPTFPTRQPRVAQIWIAAPCRSQSSLLDIMLPMLVLEVWSAWIPGPVLHEIQTHNRVLPIKLINHYSTDNHHWLIERTNRDTAGRDYWWRQFVSV